MKITPKSNPRCPACQSISNKKGFRKSKQRTTQRYLCKACRTSFTLQPKLQRHKTYPLSIILDTISNYNLGYSLKQTKNYYKKHKIKKSTLSCWYNQLKATLPYHRIRSKIAKSYKPVDIIKKKRFTHHQQPFLYQYHQPKVDIFLKHYPALKHYLENIETILPEGIFNNSERISQIAKGLSKVSSKETPTNGGDRPGVVPYGVVGRISNEVRNPSPAIGLVGVSGQEKSIINPKANVVVGISESNKNFKLTQKQNYATKLANIALQITEDNNQRHSIIESLMLKNDTATIATEVPVYLSLKNNTITGHLKEQSLTGHIDILQIRFNKLHILDFKPEKTSKEEAITQLYLYALALSRATNIEIKHFTCAYFDSKNYFEFLPY